MLLSLRESKKVYSVPGMRDQDLEALIVPVYEQFHEVLQSQKKRQLQVCGLFLTKYINGDVKLEE